MAIFVKNEFLSIRPKVLMISDWLPVSERDSNGIFVLNQCEELGKYCDLILLGFGFNQPELISVESKSNYQLVRIGNKQKIRQNITQILLNRKSIQSKLIKLLGGNPEVIHLQVLPWSNLLRRLLFPKTPFVVTEHSSAYLSKAVYSLPYPIRWLTIDGLRNSQKNWAVSNQLAEAIQRFSHRKVEVLPNIVADLSELPRIEHEGIHWIWVGDFRDSVKNYSSAIRAFDQASKDFPNQRLKVIGSGEKSTEVNELIYQLGNPQIEGPFEMGQSEVHTQMLASDAFLLSSFRETFSMATAEALSAGCLLVLSKCGGPESYLSESDAFWFHPDSFSEMKESISNAMAYLESGSTPTRRYLQKFSAEVIASQILDSYRKLLNR